MLLVALRLEVKIFVLYSVFKENSGVSWVTIPLQSLRHYSFTKGKYGRSSKLSTVAGGN